jgi:hypothetical protein
MRMHVILAVVLVGTVSMPALARSKKPLFVDPGFDASLVDELDLHGVNLSHAGNDDAGLGGALHGVLKGMGKRGYGVTLSSSGIRPTDAMLNHPASEWLRALCDKSDAFIEDGKTRTEPAEMRRWVMILVIDAMPGKPEGTFKLGTIALSLYLYDLSEATLVWRDHVERSVYGGLVGNHIWKAEIKYEQSLQLASEMALKFPKRQKH